MRSRSFSRERPEPKSRTLTLSRRLVWVAIACAIQMIYIPTSNQVSGGVEPKLPIDVFPIWSIWVVPYLLCYALWAASFAWILFKADDHFFRSFMAACLLTFSLSSLAFILFPTYVPAATLEGKDVFTVLLRYIHETWGRYSALPSGHVYITTLFALFFSRWHPQVRGTWTLIVSVVSLSTLFTAQHYILDVLGGYLVALAGYSFGLWWTRLRPAQTQTSKRPGKRISSSSVN